MAKTKDCIEQTLKAYTKKDGETSLFSKERIKQLAEAYEALEERFRDDPARLQVERKRFLDRSVKSQELYLESKANNKIKSEEIDLVLSAAPNAMEATKAIFEKSTKSFYGARNSIADIRKVMMNKFINILEIGVKDKKLEAYTHSEFDAQTAQAMFEIGTGKEVTVADPNIIELAKTYIKFNNAVVTTLRGAGIQVGEIAGYITRQTHDAVKMISATKQTWIEKTLPKIDNEKTFMEFADNMEKKVQIMSDIYDDITEHNGMNTGTSGAAKFTRSRSMHFKSGADWVAYNNEFGTTNNIMESMLGTARSASRWGAIVSKLGDKPEGTLKYLESKLDNPKQKLKVMEMYRYAIGLDEIPGVTKFSKAMAATRTFLSAKSLSNTLLASLHDNISAAFAIRAATGQNVFSSWFSFWEKYITSLPASEAKRAAEYFKIDLEQGVGIYLARTTGDEVGSGWNAKAHHWIYALNGVAKHTQMVKSGVAMHLGRALKQICSSKKISPTTMQTFFDHGFQVHDVENLGKVKDEVISSNAIWEIPDSEIKLPEGIESTPAKIKEYKSQLEMKFLVHINDFVEMSAPTAGKKEARFFDRLSDPDTAWGQIIRSVSQFKMTPLKMLNDSLYLAALESKSGSKTSMARYLGVRAVMAGISGYAIYRLEELIRQTPTAVAQVEMPDREVKNLQDLKPTDYINLIAKGGGFFGIASDIFMTGWQEPTSVQTSPYLSRNSSTREKLYKATSLIGPAGGFGLDVIEQGWGMLDRLATEDQKVFTKEQVRFIINNTPLMGYHFMYEFRKSMEETIANILNINGSTGGGW